MTSEDKKTTSVRVWMSEALELELHRLAARDDRKLSDYIGTILRRHVYGHASNGSAEADISGSAD